MPWKLGNSIIREGRSWKDSNGITHPRNWAIWSDSEKTAAGLTWEDPPAPFDNRFYWDASTPKALDDVTQEDGSVAEGLKTTWIKNTKNTANSLLSSSDWYVTRKADSGAAIPDTVQDYRSSVRAKCAEIETALNSAPNIDGFIRLFNSSEDGTPPKVNDWPTAPEGL